MDTRASTGGLRQLAPLVLVVVLGLLTLAPVVRDSPLRLLLALPLVLFAPGYALVAALVPRRSRRTRSPLDAPRDRPVHWLGRTERAVLSVVVTLVILTLLGMGLNAVGVTISLVSMVPALGVVTLGVGAVAAVRGEPRHDGWLPFERSRLTPGDGLGLPAAALVVVALLFAAGTLGFAVAADGESPATGFYLLTESGDGMATLDTYPTTFEAGDPRSLVVGIDNHGETAEYTVVVLLQRVEFVDESPRVVTERELARYTPRVAGGETWRRSHSVAPELTGQRLRLTYLLYRGDAPADPSADTAYREAYLWVDVDGEGETA